MITVVPLLLGVAGLACAVVVMVRHCRSADRGTAAPAAGDPLFFVRYRPGVTGVQSAGTTPEPSSAPGSTQQSPENPPAGEKT